MRRPWKVLQRHSDCLTATHESSITSQSSENEQKPLERVHRALVREDTGFLLPLSSKTECLRASGWRRRNKLSRQGTGPTTELDAIRVMRKRTLVCLFFLIFLLFL